MKRSSHFPPVAYAIFGALFFIGCEKKTTNPALTERGGLIETTHTDYLRDFILSKEKPENEWCGVRLQSIGKDGEVTILVVAKRQTLTAKPGDFFVSEEFGQRGLEYVSFDPITSAVALRRYWAESTSK